MNLEVAGSHGLPKIGEQDRQRNDCQDQRRGQEVRKDGDCDHRQTDADGALDEAAQYQRQRGNDDSGQIKAEEYRIRGDVPQ